MRFISAFFVIQGLFESQNTLGMKLVFANVYAVLETSWKKCSDSLMFTKIS